jgi:hypothetical protein
MAEDAVAKIASSDGTISEKASKDDILSYMTMLSFNKEEEEKLDTVSASEVKVVKTVEEKKVERAAN